MEFTPKNINKFMLFKIPSAYLSGIRVVEMDEDKAVAVRYLGPPPVFRPELGVMTDPLDPPPLDLLPDEDTP